MKIANRLSIARIRDPELRKKAQLLDELSGATDGVLEVREVDRALRTVRANRSLKRDPALAKTLRQLREAIVTQGEYAPVMRGGPRLSPMGAQLLALGGTSDDLRFVGQGTQESSVATRFDVDKRDRVLGEGQTLVVPLDDRRLHVIELQFRDTRKLAEQRFRYREPGTRKWREFSGAEWFAMKAREAAGDIEIEREPNRNAPLIQNPVFLEAMLQYPNGKRVSVGDKRVEFHVHVMKSKNQRGMIELDVLNRATEHLPKRKLPAGTVLRITARQTDLEAPASAELQLVRPIYEPEHSARKTVFSSRSFEPIDDAGYPVDKDRPIAAVKVTWADGKTDAEGELRFKTDKGSFSSGKRWVSSGETEIIATGGARCADGRLHLGGKKAEAIRVKKIEVLYGPP